jgi:hypothetical protein
VRASVLVVAACTLLVGVAACKPAKVSDTSRHLYCQVVLDEPGRDNDDAPKKIVARVRYYCDPPGVDTLALTLRLQKQRSSGSWADVVKTSFTVRKAQTVSPNKEAHNIEIYNIKEISAPCASGAFRAYVSGSSKARGFTDTYDTAGPRNVDPCRPGLFAAS